MRLSNVFLLSYQQALAMQSQLLMNYYTVFHHISELLPRDCIIVSEGANTMDIGRTMLNNYLPRHRQISFYVETTEIVSTNITIAILKIQQCFKSRAVNLTQ